MTARRESLESLRERAADLRAQVAALPPMTEAERRAQAIDFAYGNLACTTRHKPDRETFRALALSKGFDEAWFEAWAAARTWRKS